MSNNTINLLGKNASVYNNNGCGTMVVNNSSPIKYNTFEEASKDLYHWNGFLYKDRHFYRSETESLLRWIKEDHSGKAYTRVHLLSGDAGTGKSVVLSDLLHQLEKEQIAVLGLKADQLFSTSGSFDELVGLGKPVAGVILEKAVSEMVVVLIDQIDALSSALSRNRQPIKSINVFISEISKSENVRVIVSCRPYDLNYDPDLEYYRLCQPTYLQGFSREDVMIALRENDIESIDDATLPFLSNPLNLFLFLRLKDVAIFKEKIPNRTILYEALWKQLILDVPETGSEVTAKSLTSCLERISDIMYRNQVLSVPQDIISTDYPHELSYLCSLNLLYQNHSDYQIQFFHQSFFDYTYARMFLKNGNTISDILGNVHQGLFVRLRLKQILFYLRDIDQPRYIANLNSLLFDVKDNGKPKYRFHLKHLMLTNIGYLEKLTECEIQFLKHKVLVEPDYSDIYFESINTLGGLSILIDTVSQYGEFHKAPQERQTQLLNACGRVMPLFPSYVVDYLITLDRNKMTDKSIREFDNLINYSVINGDYSSEYVRLLEKFCVSSDVYYFNLLKNLVSFEPDFVCAKIVEYFKYYFKEHPEEKSKLDIRFPDDLSLVVDEVKHSAPSQYFYLLKDIVEAISNSTLWPNQNEMEIKTSSVYWNFNPKDSYPNFAETCLIDLIGEASRKAKNHEDESHLEMMAQSNLTSLTLVAVCAYSDSLNEYVAPAFGLLCRIIGSNYSESVLDYYILEMFHELFPLLDASQKQFLKRKLKDYVPDWERRGAKSKTEFGSFRFIGYTRGKFYKAMPPEDRDEYIQRELEQMERKFHTLENKEPSKIETHIGWTALATDKYETMTSEQLAKTMVQINTNVHWDWNQPTLTGHAIEMREKIALRPDVYYDAYRSAIELGAPLSYPIYGIEGFLKMNYSLEKINTLVHQVLLHMKTIERDKENIIQVSRLVDLYYKNNQKIPDELFDFLIEIVKTWDDSEYKLPEESNLSYNDGINQVRGCAAENLFRFYKDKDKIEKIFEAFEVVAEDGAISTKSAILFRLGLLCFDQAKCLKLFLDLVSDYPSTLISMPLHNQNPLLYLISYDFDSLRPYFSACLKDVKSHDVTVTLLWIACLRNIEGAKELLFQFADSSAVARVALIRDIHQYYDSKVLNLIQEILYRYFLYDDEDLGRQYDYIFDNVKSWSFSDQVTYMKSYVQSNVCKYCSRNLLGYLSKMSVEQPKYTLQWISGIYDLRPECLNFEGNLSKFINILIAAYNTVKKYDSEDEILESAMTLLDTWLHDRINRQYMLRYFKQLDN